MTPTMSSISKQTGRAEAIVIGALAVGAVLLLWFGRTRVADRPDVPRPGQIAPVRSPPKKRGSTPAPEPVRERGDAPPDALFLPPTDPRPALAEKLEHSRAKFATIERRFETQDPRPGVSDRFEEHLVARFRNSRLREIVELEAVECRRTICSIDLRYRSSDQLGEKIARVINEWLRESPDCSYHVPGELLLTPSDAGEVSQRLWVECHAL